MARKKCPDPKKTQTTFNHEFDAQFGGRYEDDPYSWGDLPEDYDEDTKFNPNDW